MSINFLHEVFQSRSNNDAIIWQDRVVKYVWLNQRITELKETIASNGIGAGSVVAIEGDFSPETIALFLALTSSNCIIVPLHYSTQEKNKILEIA